MLKSLRFWKGGGRGFNPLRNVKLGPKLLGGFLVVALFTAVLGFISLSTSATVGAEFTKLEEDIVPGALSILGTETGLLGLITEVQTMVHSGEATHREHALESTAHMMENMEEHVALAEGTDDEEYLQAMQYIENEATSHANTAVQVMDSVEAIAAMQVEYDALLAEMREESKVLEATLEKDVSEHLSELVSSEETLNHAIATGNLVSVSEEFNLIEEDIVPGAISIMELQIAFSSLFNEMDAYLVSGDEESLNEMLDTRELIQRIVAEHVAIALRIGGDEAVDMQELENQASHVLSLSSQLLDIADNLTLLQTENEDTMEQMLSSAEELVAFIEDDVVAHKGEVVDAADTVAQAHATGQQAVWVAVGASLVMAVGIGFTLTRSILKPVNVITALFGNVGMGDFEARAEVVTGDELGDMTIGLNAMLDSTLGLIQTREDRDAMQASVQKLLSEVSGVAEGDLTVEAEVTADITGAIADSFNLMIGQLRNIITGVQDATLQVSSSANEIQTTTEHLSQGSESQATQIADASAAIEEMAVSIGQVSENATVSATVGEQSLANAQQGTLAVQNTVDGMNRIRDQVQETAKRIKRLGEGSQEIGEIVQLIGDIADRTSILALNASIQAAMAGEAGQGFAVVAEEVERLAERSTEATKQIDTLIRTIQNETNEAVAAMEATTNEVVEGSLLAEEAGQALSEIGAVSQRLAELSQSISLASKQQARGSETLAKSMSDIADVTQQTAAGTKQAAVSISTLATLADELRESVSAFKMPSGNGRESV